MFLVFILIIIAYLLGSIPASVWIGKVVKGIDVRNFGSGNAGTTNAIRVLGLRNGVAVLVIDCLKGFLAVMLSKIFVPEVANDNLLMLFRFTLAIIAVVGHIFPVFAGFKGGKGIATMVGAMFALMPLSLLLAIGVFIIVFLITHTVSISSVIAAVSFPWFCLIFGRYADIYHIIFAVIAAVAIIITHRHNIVRIFNGTEPRLHLNQNKRRKIN